MVVNIQGLPVHYIDLGAGPETVVILEGWGTNAGLYRDLAAHLSRTMRVLLPELPGCGETPEPPRSLDAAGYAELVRGFLRQLGVREAHLIGHSNGGRIILKLCAEPTPDLRFHKLVFMGSAGVVLPGTPRQKRRLKRMKLLKALLKPFPGLLERYRQTHGSADYRAASPVMRETLVRLVNEDLTPLMPGVRQSALLIWGTADTDTPMSHARIFAEQLPDAGLVEVPGAGHYAYLEQPGFVFRVLDAYFGANHG